MKKILFCIVALSAVANAQTMWDAEPDYWIPIEQLKEQQRKPVAKKPVIISKQQPPVEKPQEVQEQCEPCMQTEPTVVQTEESEVQSFWAKHGKKIETGGLAIVAVCGLIYGYNYFNKKS